MEVVLASRNSKKLKELSDIFAPLGWKLRLLSEFSDGAAAEDAPSFVENALKKARYAANASGLPALADDSGLAVDALNGAPGVWSARYAGENASDADNNAKLLADMAHLTGNSRVASFVCELVFLRHANDPLPLTARGLWRGSILDQPEGEFGFGYDPLFWVEEQECTSAQLPSGLKNAISHRALAADNLINQLDQLKLSGN